jgi:hypothetical protein
MHDRENVVAKLSRRGLRRLAPTPRDQQAQAGHYTHRHGRSKME